MSQVILLVKLQAKHGKENDLFKALTEMIQPSRQEAGCLQYDLNREIDKGAVFWFVEKWESQNALDEHNKTPHYLKLKEVLGDLIDDAQRVTLEPVKY